MNPDRDHEAEKSVSRSRLLPSIQLSGLRGLLHAANRDRLRGNPASARDTGVTSYFKTLRKMSNAQAI
jgi:hypothetical protein